MGDIIDNEKVNSHLLSVHKYNFKTDLSDHANPQRAGYAYGKEGGLILCSWPKGGETFPALCLQQRSMDRHRISGCFTSNA